MSDEATPNLALPMLAAGQAQKHVTVNEALTLLDAVVQLAILQSDLTAPPASPAEGDRYIVAATATGDWAGHEDDIAVWRDGAWAFVTPFTGFLAYDVAAEGLFAFDGTAWVGAAPAVTQLQELELLGVNATADATNKLSVASAAVLFNHIGAGTQIKANKNAAGDTVSVLFQTAFSGRAEFGLAGSDDYSVKVSGDGSAWNTAYTVARSTGRITLPKTPTVSDQAPAALTFAASLTPDLDDGRAFLLTATGDFTLNPPTNLVAGAVFWVRITQDGTGGRAITFDAAYRFAGGSAPTLSAGAGDADMLYCVVVDAATPIIDAALRKGV